MRLKEILCRHEYRSIEAKPHAVYRENGWTWGEHKAICIKCGKIGVIKREVTEDEGDR